MAIADQVTRLQNIRNQIRKRMVTLGLSGDKDLLEKLANDLDGVDKISPTNNGTTDPEGYTNVDTLNRSTSTRYIKVPKGYNDANRKFTVEGVSNGAYSASVSSHTSSNATASSSVAGSVTNIATTTKPSTGTDGTNYYTITPKLTTAKGSSKATGKATIDTAGYLAAGNKSSSESSIDVGVTATQGSDYYLKAGSYSASVSSHTTSNATAGSSVAGSITNISSTTKPAGTDSVNYYTITPKLTTSSGSSKATGKATIDAAGYVATGNTTSSESSKDVEVTASPGDSYYLKAGSYSASVSSHTTSNATAESSITGTITDIASTTKPSGTDGTNYYTITPKLTTSSGSSKATGKATIDAAGYVATGNTTSSESSKDVEVTASPGDSYYLKASSVSAEDPGSSYINQITVTPSGTDAQYVKITAGYLPNSKITVKKMAGGSISSATTDDPGTSYTNKATVTPTKSTQYVKITAGYLPNSKVTVEAIPKQTFTLTKDNWSTMIPQTPLGTYGKTVTVNGVTADNDIAVIPDENSTSVVKSCGVYASGQGASSITFKAFNKPTSDISYTVYILNK